MRELKNLTKEEKLQILKRMYLDISYFAEMVLPETVYDETPSFHKEIFDYLERDDIKKLSIICPRGHGKSTLATKIYPLHRIAFSQYSDTKFIIIVSESLDQSINLLRDISDEIEFNDRFRYFFGDLKGPKWTETDLITRNKVRIWARGSRQRIRGSKFLNRRPDLIILDDFESELNTETFEQRDKLKRWVNGAVLPAPDPKRGKVFLIGTIIHEDAYLSDIKNDDDNRLGWYRRMYKAGLPEGKPLWEVRYPLEKLQEIRDQLSAQGYEHIYYQEYENEAITPGTGLAHNISHTDYVVRWSDYHDLYFIEEDGLWKSMYTFLGLDPSLGTMGGDMTGEVILGRTCEDKFYVLETNPLRLGTFELVERVFDTIKRWNIRILNIETVAFQKMLKDYVYKLMPKKGLVFGVREYKPKDKKAVRLHALSPYYYGGHIFHNGLTPELDHQLKSFPKAKHDDLLDALWMAIQGSYPPSAREFNPELDKKGMKRKFYQKKRINWATGFAIED